MMTGVNLKDYDDPDRGTAEWDAGRSRGRTGLEPVLYKAWTFAQRAAYLRGYEFGVAEHRHAIRLRLDLEDM